MTKLNLRYLYAAGAGALIAAAAIAIPAWGASGGGDSGTHSQAPGVLPPPPPATAGGFGLTAQASSPAEAKRMRSKFDDFATCMRNQGADVPGVQPNGNGVSIQMPRLEARGVMEKVAKKCGMPPPPAPGKALPSRKQIEKSRKAIARGDCPAPPLPFAAPRRK
jgi:hypothetical protein